jgi:hypothetical protein
VQAQTQRGANDGVTVERAGGDGPSSRLTSARVWRELAKASFAIVSYATPAGEPRSSGVLYAITGRRMYVVTADESWKASTSRSAARSR